VSWSPRPALKKSVTIDPGVLESLGSDRRSNLSATVNDSLALVAALDAQRQLVRDWEEEHGPFTEDELKPFLDVVLRAQLETTLRGLRGSARRPARGLSVPASGPRPRRPAGIATVATMDTGWLVAAERNPAAARRHVAALTRVGQVLLVTPVVVVEARQGPGDEGELLVALAKLRREPILPEDGDRAAELLQEAGRQAADPAARIGTMGIVDALVAAVAERRGGIVYTGDPKHMTWLRDAGARITVAPVSF
jgi:predicted nucleic acid-binding protein